MMNKILVGVGYLIGLFCLAYLLWFGIVYGLTWAFDFEFKQKYVIGAMLISITISILIRGNRRK